ncbi:hypothetical protein CCR75_003659 [Bremia lactucae]|uniref:Uncharacterized protein n=1 Tax=Bremia lactucae TaxID=4779 RepID=A0A976ILI3_BRELC|nr:hypothetical protein CCR75_003659 [Bremia lactucae]
MCKRLKTTIENSIKSIDQSVLDAELSSINALLQEEETSQKQTWQIGKRVKTLLESHKDLPLATQLDAYFLWGAALARLASLHEDSTLATAAADKFEQMKLLSQNDVHEDAVDAALGPVGFSLWGSSLLIVAIETQSQKVLKHALEKFQQAVHVDGGTTFETRFQYAKALKEGGDLVVFLDPQKGISKSTNSYYIEALNECKKLETIYQNEKILDQKQETDDDFVTLDDFAAVKLLEAVLYSQMEDATSRDAFYRTLSIFQSAMVVNCGKIEALIELTTYYGIRVLSSATNGVDLSLLEWIQLFDALEAQYTTILREVGFDLQAWHDGWKKHDMPFKLCQEEEDFHAQVPHLLHSLGKGFAAFVKAFKVTKTDPRWTKTVNLLQFAHCLHDQLGSYELACLYAFPAYQDEDQCRIWLETAHSYGALEDEFDVDQFHTMHEKAWFQCLTHPLEQDDAWEQDEEDGRVLTP